MEVMMESFLRNLLELAEDNGDRKIPPDFDPRRDHMPVWMCDVVKSDVHEWAEIVDGLMRCGEKEEATDFVASGLQERFVEFETAAPPDCVERLICLLEDWDCRTFAATVREIASQSFLLKRVSSKTS